LVVICSSSESAIRLSWSLGRMTSGEEVLPSFGVALTARPGHQSMIRTDDFAAAGLRSGFGNPAMSLRASHLNALTRGGENVIFMVGGRPRSTECAA
jgi:hypothetical protein